MTRSNNFSPRGMILRRSLWTTLIALCLALSACGGGDDSSATSFTAAPTVSTDSSTLAPNMLAVTVGGGPSNNINLPMVSITVCSPGTSNCQTINDVLVDTGSSGVRIFSSVLAPSISLPQEMLTDGSALAECTPFADGGTWGPVMVADIRIAGESANSIPIQVIGDVGFANIPQTCTDTGPLLNTPRLFGANGVLGVGAFREDCGPFCAGGIGHGIYFACKAGTCSVVAAPITQQVQNPVAFFAVNNNGASLTLPTVPPEGAETVTGTLTFGIGTQTNNGLNGATIFTISPNTGLFTTVYKGVALNTGFIDSGSNGLFFDDLSIPVCSSGFYCPVSTLSLSAVNIGQNGTQGTVSFSVANADNLLNNNLTHDAFDNLAGTALNSDVFDWGLPFFFGRTVFIAIETADTPGGPGPFFAY